MKDIHEHIKEAKRTGDIEFFIEERREDCVISRMPTGQGALNPFGTIHAGAMIWLADVTATVLVAQQAAAAAMDKVMAALKADGVADSDIKTTGYSVYPVYNYESGRTPAITGYNVSNTITVKIRDIDEAGNIIDDVEAAAGNDIRVNNISFTVDNPEQYNSEARALAMADALDRAQQLADLGGVQLGKPAYITESGGYTAQPPIYYDVKAGASTSEIVTPISPGETELQLSVQVVYNIQ